MSRDEAIAGLLLGADLVEQAYTVEGYNLVGTGDMGIANTTPSTAIVAVLSGHPVAELAGRFSLSPGRFTRRFREAVGVSPYQYYQHRRIQHACWLLLNTRHTVTEVAFMLGFADSPHFERAFRSRRKMTPNAYRKRFGEKAT